MIRCWSLRDDHRQQIDNKEVVKTALQDRHSGRAVLFWYAGNEGEQKWKKS